MFYFGTCRQLYSESILNSVPITAFNVILRPCLCKYRIIVLMLLVNTLYSSILICVILILAVYFVTMHLHLTLIVLHYFMLAFYVMSMYQITGTRTNALPDIFPPVIFDTRTYSLQSFYHPGHIPYHRFPSRLYIAHVICAMI